MAKKKELSAEALAEYLTSWLRKWFSDNKRDTAVIGISGGKDSAVVAALCVNALGNGNVFGVVMPNGVQSDIDDAHAVCSELGIALAYIPVTDPFNAVEKSIIDGFKAFHENNVLHNFQMPDTAKFNIAPRLRMTTLYAVAQSMSCFGRHAAVVGTGNLGEAQVGYTTKWGDSASDVNPLRELWVDEVIAVGDALGHFPNIIHKTPMDGLCGQSDETRLGFSYDDVKAVLDSHADSTDVHQATRDKVISAYQRSAHKRTEIPHPSRRDVIQNCWR